MRDHARLKHWKNLFGKFRIRRAWQCPLSVIQFSVHHHLRQIKINRHALRRHVHGFCVDVLRSLKAAGYFAMCLRGMIARLAKGPAFGERGLHRMARAKRLEIRLAFVHHFLRIERKFAQNGTFEFEFFIGWADGGIASGGARD